MPPFSVVSVGSVCHFPDPLISVSICGLCVPFFISHRTHRTHGKNLDPLFFCDFRGFCVPFFPHTDFTDLTDFISLDVNVFRALRGFCVPFFLYHEESSGTAPKASARKLRLGFSSAILLNISV